MNFKLSLFIFFYLIFLNSCGVKSPPKPYDEIAIPSYVNSYTGEESLAPVTPPKEKEKKK